MQNPYSYPIKSPVIDYLLSALKYLVKGCQEMQAARLPDNFPDQDIRNMSDDPGDIGVDITAATLDKSEPLPATSPVPAPYSAPEDSDDRTQPDEPLDAPAAKPEAPVAIEEPAARSRLQNIYAQVVVK